jgi:hypothetical protein
MKEVKKPRGREELERERELNKNPNPGTLKRLEKVFGKGAKQLKQLSRGVVSELEDEEEDLEDGACSWVDVEDEIENIKDELEDEQLLEFWAKVASGHKGIQEQIKRRAVMFNSSKSRPRK